MKPVLALALSYLLETGSPFDPITNGTTQLMLIGFLPVAVIVNYLKSPFCSRSMI